MVCTLATADMTAKSTAWVWNDVNATTTAGGTHLAHRHADAQLLVTDGRLRAGHGYATASAETRRDLARVGAIIRLRQQGRYLVHAAGVVDPHGRAWLLSGNTGAGKSTLAYALSRAGWTILGDDGVVVELRGGTVIAHQWRDPLHVSRALASQFPELHDHAGRARAGDYRERIPMAAPPARTASVCAIVMLERASARDVSRLGPLDALGALVRQSPLVMIDDGYSRRHLDALRRIVGVPCFRLRHTSAELHSIARVLADMIPA